MNKLENIADKTISNLLLLFGFAVAGSCFLLVILFFPDVVSRISERLDIVAGFTYGNFWVLDDIFAWCVEAFLAFTIFVYFFGGLGLMIFIFFKVPRFLFGKERCWCSMVKAVMTKKKIVESEA